MVSISCDICKKKIGKRYVPETLVAHTLQGDEFIVSGPRYHIEIKDPLNDNEYLDICEECHERISVMITKLIKEENDGCYGIKE